MKSFLILIVSLLLFANCDTVDQSVEKVDDEFPNDIQEIYKK